MSMTPATSEHEMSVFGKGTGREIHTLHDLDMEIPPQKRARGMLEFPWELHEDAAADQELSYPDSNSPGLDVVPSTGSFEVEPTQQIYHPTPARPFTIQSQRLSALMASSKGTSADEAGLKLQERIQSVRCPCMIVKAEDHKEPRVHCSNPSCIHPGGRWIQQICFHNNSTRDGVEYFKTCSHCRHFDAEKKRQRRRKIANVVESSQERIASLEAELRSVTAQHNDALDMIQNLLAENATLRAAQASPVCGAASRIMANLQQEMLLLRALQHHV